MNGSRSQRRTSKHSSAALACDVQDCGRTAPVFSVQVMFANEVMPKQDRRPALGLIWSPFCFRLFFSSVQLGWCAELPRTGDGVRIHGLDLGSKNPATYTSIQSST